MKTNLLIKKDSYRIWFEFYKLALQNKSLSVNKGRYDQWGTDVENLKFDEWWKSHSYLFVQPVVKIVKSEEEMDSPYGILIEVPMNKSVTETLSDIKDLLHKQYKSNKKSKKVLIGKYQLTEDKEPKLKIIKEVLNVYKDVYLKMDNPKGQKFYDAVVHYYASRKKNTRIPSQLIDVNRGNSSAVRTLGRWIQKAKRIESNVANGEFPGKY
jgi:hypothetical protein